MTWINNLFFLIILNSITGGLAQLLWYLLQKHLEQKNKIKSVYPTLKIVALFYTIPVVYILFTLQSVNFGEHISFVNGMPLFTPVITQIMKVVAMIWFAGMLWSVGNYGFQYIRLRRILHKSFKVINDDMKSEFERIYKKLQIKEKVRFYQNYALTSPIVTGTFCKKIVLPVRTYNQRELVTVLHHELTHVKKKDLLYKKIGIFLNLVFWFNPFAHILHKQLEEWSETSCDLLVCYFQDCGISVKEYYEYALCGLQENLLITNKFAMFFNEKDGLKRRILRMKHYKREKELKFAVGGALALAFSFVTATTSLAAGQGAIELYNTAYDMTDVAIEEELTMGFENTLTEYTEPAGEDAGVTIIDAQNPLSRASNIIDWTVNGNSIVRTTAFSKSSGTISVTVAVKSGARVGIYEPNGTRRYVVAGSSGSVAHSFSVSSSGSYRVFVENTSSTAFKASGSYVK